MGGTGGGIHGGGDGRMTNREFVLQILRDLGRADALSLRSRAAGMDGTGIIAEEHKIPAWDAGRDYTGDCCVWQGTVYRSKNDNNPYAPGDYPAWWEEVTL